MNMYADEEGVIGSITGLSQARQLESVVYLEKHAKAGDMALFAGNGGRLIVDGILANKDETKLKEDMLAVRKLIKINVEAKKPAAV